MNHEIYQGPGFNPEPVEGLTTSKQTLYSEGEGLIFHMEGEPGEVPKLPTPSEPPVTPEATSQGKPHTPEEKAQIAEIGQALSEAVESEERMPPPPKKHQEEIEKKLGPKGEETRSAIVRTVRKERLAEVEVRGQLEGEPDLLTSWEEFVNNLPEGPERTEQLRRIREEKERTRQFGTTLQREGLTRRQRREELRSELYFGFTDADVEFFERIIDLTEKDETRPEAERLVRERFEGYLGELEKVPTRQFFESANELIVRKLNALVNLWRSKTAEGGREFFDEIQVRFVTHELNRILLTEPNDLKKYASAAHLLLMTYVNRLNRMKGVPPAFRFFEQASGRTLRNKNGIFTNEDVDEMEGWVRQRMRETLVKQLGREPTEEEWRIQGEKGINLGRKLFTIMQRLSYFVSQSRFPRDSATGKIEVLSRIKRLPGEMFAVLYNPREISWERYRIGGEGGARFRELTGPMTPKMADFYSSGWRAEELLTQLDLLDPQQNLGLWLRFRMAEEMAKRTILDKIIEHHPLSFLSAYRNLVSREEGDRFIAGRGPTLDQLEDTLAVEEELALEEKRLPELEDLRRQHPILNELLSFARSKQGEFLKFKVPPGDQARTAFLADIPLEDLDHVLLQEDSYKRLVEGDNMIASEAIGVLASINTDPRDLSRTSKLRETIQKYDSLDEEQNLIRVVLEGQLKYLKKRWWAELLPDLPDWARILLKKFKITISDSQLYQAITSPALSSQTERNRIRDFAASGHIDDKQEEELIKAVGVQALKATLTEEYRALPAYLQAFLKPFVEYFLGVKL